MFETIGLTQKNERVELWTYTIEGMPRYQVLHHTATGIIARAGRVFHELFIDRNDAVSYAEEIVKR